MRPLPPRKKRAMKLTTYGITLLLLTLPPLAHSSQYVWIDTGNGGQWVLVNPDHERPAINENWADQHLNDPDTGFNNLELEIN